MNLNDATLMFLNESAPHPEVARLAQHAYEELTNGREVHHTTLDDLIGKASEKGVLRALSHKYSPTAYEAMLMPILREIDRQRPIPPRRRPPAAQGSDPLTAATWPS
jgi:hypothetical protein